MEYGRQELVKGFSSARYQNINCGTQLKMNISRHVDFYEYLFPLNPAPTGKGKSFWKENSVSKRDDLRETIKRIRKVTFKEPVSIECLQVTHDDNEDILVLNVDTSLDDDVATDGYDSIKKKLVAQLCIYVARKKIETASTIFQYQIQNLWFEIAAVIIFIMQVVVLINA